MVAASTFGAAGSEWLCGIAIALAAVVWYAVAINFAVDSTLLGLRACGLIIPAGVASWPLGPLEIKSPVFLGTALFWVYITRQAIRMRLPGVVVALMKVYSPIAVLLLAATAVWRLHLLWSVPGGSGPAALLASSSSAQGQPHEAALPLMVGFFAMSGLLSVDWGAAVRSRRDFFLAGIPCVLATAAFSSIMSLLAVLETTNLLATAGSSLSAGRLDPLPFSFRWAVYEGRDTFPPGAAATILILFGLAALAPAVASLNKVSESVSIHWPTFTPRGASAIVGLVALFLMGTFQVDRLGPIFTAMGTLFAPVLGAMTGDLTRRVERGPTIRNGLNPAGILAWAAGFAVAASLAALTSIRPQSSIWLEQGSIYGFVVSACIYRLLAGVASASHSRAMNESNVER